MKNLNFLNKFRVPHHSGGLGDETCGAFLLQGPCSQQLKIIASSGVEGYEWDHVSISLKNRCPNWSEMDWVKKNFFKKDELAIQFHVPEDDHINLHPHTLHLWRPHNIEIPLPPKIMV